MGQSVHRFHDITNNRTGALKSAGMRFRILRGPWEKSGNDARDYVSSQALRRRLAEIEAGYADAKQKT